MYNVYSGCSPEWTDLDARGWGGGRAVVCPPGGKCSVSAPGVCAGGGARSAFPGLLGTACSGDQSSEQQILSPAADW